MIKLLERPSWLSGGVALCAAIPFAGTQPQPVAFDWFEYAATNAVATKIGAGELEILEASNACQATS